MKLRCIHQIPLQESLLRPLLWFPQTFSFSLKWLQSPVNDTNVFSALNLQITGTFGMSYQTPCHREGVRPQGCIIKLQCAIMTFKFLYTQNTTNSYIPVYTWMFIASVGVATPCREYITWAPYTNSTGLNWSVCNNYLKTNTLYLGPYYTLKLQKNNKNSHMTYLQFKFTSYHMCGQNNFQRNPHQSSLTLSCQSVPHYTLIRWVLPTYKYQLATEVTKPITRWLQTVDATDP